jgi:transcriptional regulator with XRE-family HTH domain
MTSRRTTSMTSEVMTRRIADAYARDMQIVRPESAFGPLLRSHRVACAMSQEKLAATAEVSTRHLSCLETGRASPSREMVLVLASALELPLRDRNALLGAAGFAAAYRESKLDDAAMRELDGAIGLLLAKLEPYPAIVVDRAWNVVRMNTSAARFLPMLLPPGSPPELLSNAVRAVVDPRGARPYLVNWEEVVRSIVERARMELAREPEGSPGHAMLEEMLAFPGVRETLRRAPSPTAPLPFLPLHIRRDGVEARFFTMLTTLGTPLDVTAEELSIEAYFPADAATRALLDAMAAS